MDIKNLLHIHSDELSLETKFELMKFANLEKHQIEKEIKNIFSNKDYHYLQDRLIDKFLGFNISKVEESFRVSSKGKRVISHLGEASWSESNLDRIENYLTSYKSFYNLLNYLIKKQNIKTIIDLGCAYGRFGMIVGIFFPDIKFIGYEINKYRFQEAKRVATKNQFNNVTFYNQDLSSPEFKVPEACLYYAYDPVNNETRIKIFQKDIPSHKKKYLLAARETGEFARFLYNCEHLARIGRKHSDRDEQLINIYMPVSYGN